ncbi:MAG: hypothetical protein KAT90_11720 [Gammaproteobacteria bacterium]|nr:hypothetical protein [Gammaproteobacteria bacterium]
MPLCNDITKDREIRFTHSLTKADQAETAARLLTDVAGIELAVPVRPNVLRVRYDIREISLQMLESALVDVGYSLRNNLAKRFKRELIAYCEDALRSSLGIEIDQQHPPSLSLTKAEVHHHSLDPRPDNWRNYI